MKRILLGILFILTGFLTQSQTRTDLAILDSVTHIATYFGGSKMISVKDSVNGGFFYLYQGGLPVNGSNIVAGANSSKWKRIYSDPRPSVIGAGGGGSLYIRQNTALGLDSSLNPIMLKATGPLAIGVYHKFYSASLGSDVSIYPRIMTSSEYITNPSVGKWIERLTESQTGQEGSPTARKNVIWDFGYNTDQAITGEGYMRIAMESNYRPGGGQEWFEYHDPEVLFRDGTMLRWHSVTGSKATRNGTHTWMGNSYTFQDETNTKTYAAFAPGTSSIRTNQFRISNNTSNATAFQFDHTGVDRTFTMTPGTAGDNYISFSGGNSALYFGGGLINQFNSAATSWYVNTKVKFQFSNPSTDQLFISDGSNTVFKLSSNSTNDGVDIQNTKGDVLFGANNASSVFFRLMSQGYSTSYFGVKPDGKIGLYATSSPAISLVTSATDAWGIPVGTTGERPTGAAGYIRYNSTLGNFEGHNGITWAPLGGGGLSGLTTNRAVFATSSTTIGDDAGYSYNPTTNELSVDRIKLATTSTSIAPLNIGGFGTIPTSPTAGDIVFDASDSSIKIRSGSNWIPYYYGKDVIAGTNVTIARGTGWNVPDTINVAGGGISDGDKGDITVSGSGTTFTIDNQTVTYAKIQNVTDARLLGRSAGSAGSAQEITVSSDMSLSAGVLGVGSNVPLKNGTNTFTGTNTFSTNDVTFSNISPLITGSTAQLKFTDQNDGRTLSVFYNTRKFTFTAQQSDFSFRDPLYFDLSAPANALNLHSTGTLRINTVGTGTDIASRKLYVNGSVGFNKDSLTTVTSISTENFALVDNTTGQVKKVTLANVATSLGLNNSNTWTPTYTYTTNTSATSSGNFRYQQIGDQIYIHGEIVFNPTTTGTAQLDISLPFANGITNSYDVSGTGVSFAKPAEPVEIFYNNGGGTIAFKTTITSTGTRTYKFTAIMHYQAP